jgi:hypothetical protein
MTCAMHVLRSSTPLVYLPLPFFPSLPPPPAPWPCWHIAASPSFPTDLLSTFLTSLEPYVTHFNSPQAREKEDVEFVSGYFGHQPQDVVEWLSTVRWEEGLKVVKKEVVLETLR